MPRKKIDRHGDRNGRLTSLRQDKFLRAYVHHGTLGAASRELRMGYATHYRWLADDDYARRFEHAKHEAVDRLLEEARRRGMDGVDDPVIHKGKRVFEDLDAEGRPVEAPVEGGRRAPVAVKKYSDSLLMFLLKGLAPEFKTVRVDGEGDGNGLRVTINVGAVSQAMDLIEGKPFEAPGSDDGGAPATVPD